jgi:hypothetical protein
MNFLGTVLLGTPNWHRTLPRVATGRRAFVVPCHFGDAKVTDISAQDRNENFVIIVAFSG